ncbi:MAG TPA: hypothetical protein VMU09_11565 [Acidimicrobiales bacterium]|nr:hypothetical protein [Acidimicrobiales bacterium]
MPHDDTTIDHEDTADELRLVEAISALIVDLDMEPSLTDAAR